MDCVCVLGHVCMCFVDGLFFALESFCLHVAFTCRFVCTAYVASRSFIFVAVASALPFASALEVFALLLAFSLLFICIALFYVVCIAFGGIAGLCIAVVKGGFREGRDSDGGEPPILCSVCCICVFAFFVYQCCSISA